MERRCCVFVIFPQVVIQPIGASEHEHDVLPRFPIPMMMQSLTTRGHDAMQFVHEFLLALFNQRHVSIDRVANTFQPCEFFRRMDGSLEIQCHKAGYQHPGHRLSRIRLRHVQDETGASPLARPERFGSKRARRREAQCIAAVHQIRETENIVTTRVFTRHN